MDYSNVFIELFVYKCCLLITFVNNLDPDQAQHNVGPDLYPSCLTVMVP